MKQPIISTALLVMAFSTHGVVTAQELGQVISRTAVYQAVAVPRQTCVQTPVAVSSTSGAGALMGAIAGGAMGNAVGDGSGRALATMIGIVGGAMVGDRIEAPSTSHSVNQTHCSTQTAYENRLVAYNVVYEYAGKQYSAQLPQDPGPTIALSITPQVQDMRNQAPPAPEQVTVITQPPQVVYLPAPVYGTAPVYHPAPVYWHAPVYRSRPSLHTHIDLSWRANRPVARHPSHRHPSDRPPGVRHPLRDDRQYWR
ncbi:hypothetical protein [Limnohabitans sp.]|uniref:hypothetical protein n=1 Tax=Limnohabitans sp. TaxID=1907725 RepID=UPI0037BF8094